MEAIPKNQNFQKNFWIDKFSDYWSIWGKLFYRFPISVLLSVVCPRRALHWCFCGFSELIESAQIAPLRLEAKSSKLKSWTFHFFGRGSPLWTRSECTAKSSNLSREPHRFFRIDFGQSNLLANWKTLFGRTNCGMAPIALTQSTFEKLIFVLHDKTAKNWSRQKKKTGPNSTCYPKWSEKSKKHRKKWDRPQKRAGQKTCCNRESNSGRKLGKLAFYHWTTTAADVSTYLRPLFMLPACYKRVRTEQCAEKSLPLAMWDTACHTRWHDLQDF